MVAVHPFTTALDSVLGMYSPTTQPPRQVPVSTLSEPFVLLHDMLFTNIQLHDFKRVMERFHINVQIAGQLYTRSTYESSYTNIILLRMVSQSKIANR